MNIREAIKARHSVRQYKDMPIAEDAKEKLEEMIRQCNEEGSLHMQLICDDPECFDTFLAHYGKFKNANHYIAIVGPKDLTDLEEKSGYYGEKVVLYAQQLGLNTCWVAGTYRKGKCKATLSTGEKIVCVISIGYGKTDGVKHRSKSLNKICQVPE